MKGWPDFELPSIAAVIQRTLDIGMQVNPNLRCVGISVNTSSLDDAERVSYLAQLSADYGLPAVDPIALGVGPLVDFLTED
jgi:uncharacterized NAD-dependent epimerase/dehydratase family protein